MKKKYIWLLAAALTGCTSNAEKERMMIERDSVECVNRNLERELELMRDSLRRDSALRAESVDDEEWDGDTGGDYWGENDEEGDGEAREIGVVKERVKIDREKKWLVLKTKEGEKRIATDSIVSVSKIVRITAEGNMGTSVVWAKKNIGAKAYWDWGEQYAWGETELKDFPCKEADYMCSMAECGTKKDPIYGIEDIRGTKFDVCRKKLGGTWRLPTIEEYGELVASCKWTREFVVINGDTVSEGMKAVCEATNDSLYFPASEYDRSKNKFWGEYWTSSRVRDAIGYDHYARRFDFADYGVALCKSWCRYCGLSVRAVRDVAENEKEIRYTVVYKEDGEEKQIEGSSFTMDMDNEGCVVQNKLIVVE